MNTRSFFSGALLFGLGSAVIAACGGSGDSQGTTSGTTSTGSGGSGATTSATGTGGATTSSTTNSSSGGGGTGGCATAADCDDGFSCTVDTCNAGVCGHVAGPNSGATACPAGSFCQVGKGCVPGFVCATTAQCVTQLGGDPCKTNITCDAATSVCMFSILDKDGDGHPPVVCGGDDCNDADANIYPGAPEVCDGKSNGCAGLPADQGATCPGLEVCTAGACACPAANTCGASCVDKATDNENCGSCGNACPSAATCQAGKCICASGATVCNGACVDIKTDPQNCNGCNQACATGYACQNGACACLKTACGGACVDTQTDPAHCGNCTTACTGGATCQAGTCVCPTGLTLCGSACVDTKTDANNCNGCGIVCGACQNGQCIACPPADLYLLQDLSGSMVTTLPNGVTRIASSQGAIDAFVAEPASSGLGVGVGYFPLITETKCTTDADCGFPGFYFCQNGVCTSGASDSCTPADYAVPAVGIATLPGVAGAITTSVNAQVANGGTPQKQALEGALTYAKGYLLSHPTHQIGVVLITDGIPNECSYTTAADTAAVAAAFAGATPPVRTFVIGIGNEVTPAEWNSIAVAGKTGSAYIATDQASLQAALDSIRAAVKTCP